MARTEGAKSIAIYDDEVLLVEGVNSINFTGAGVVGSVDGDGNVTETIDGGSSSGTTVFGEVVSGNVNTFTLAHTPMGTISLSANGQVLNLTTDYTISGSTITTLATWSTGQLIANYSY